MTQYVDNYRISSVLRWFGGKHFLSKELVPLLPLHHCWADVFGGGAHMTVAKKKSTVEVFNDTDNELINFLLVLRSEKLELIHALESLPTSRTLFESWLYAESPVDPFEKAVRWYYLLRQCIIPANGIKSGWRSGKIKNTAKDYQNSITKLDAFEQRFRQVMIECLDYKDLITRYDGPETFFFVDPPYCGRENYYKGNFKEHEKLADMLHKIDGKCMVTYYGDPLILELYKDWNRLTFDSKVGTVTKAHLGQTRRIETEFVFMNYDPPQESKQICLF
ncbi:DNA adenine methylase [Paenibacillus sp. UMB7766-LJ446]|uniref:DNA adenine methylase n=1 Tax=Paenibacillus sp. UMB7766-LJ446 TaxID=3046313 RepID=UPI002551791A|nr:DNA adenine methylase [Paenibacillus sp. UMB7766-LJ446]MDK8193215.1 DNA adenine methylase [Paenibacillus sp. UMB7766-LJ446]